MWLVRVLQWIIDWWRGSMYTRAYCCGDIYIQPGATCLWRTSDNRDMPVMVHASGSMEYSNTKIYWFCNLPVISFHRDFDQPAYIGSCGQHEWWYNGKLHRDDDLPAIISGDGVYVGYFRHGQQYYPHCVKL